MAKIWSANDEKDICISAQSLITGQRNFMDQYLIGSLDPYLIAHMIHHNNIFHGGKTADQMVRICEIVDERTDLAEYEDAKYLKADLIVSIRNNLVEIQNSDTKAQTDFRACNYTREHRSIQKRRQEDKKLQNGQLNSARCLIPHEPFCLNKYALAVPYHPAQCYLPVFNVVSPNKTITHQSSSTLRIISREVPHYTTSVMQIKYSTDTS